jgi:hypothetical protein
MSLRALFLLASGSLLATSLLAQPVLLGENLSSNRWDSMPHDRLQVVVFYDGLDNHQASLQLQVHRRGPDGGIDWITIDQLEVFGTMVETREYDLDGWEPTGRFIVDGVQNNGVVDGVAWGIYWRNGDGDYYTLRSRDGEGSPRANFICAWPLQMNDSLFASRTPQVTDSYARDNAKMVICGAELVPNGKYFSMGLGSHLFGVENFE